MRRTMAAVRAYLVEMSEKKELSDRAYKTAALLWQAIASGDTLPLLPVEELLLGLFIVSSYIYSWREIEGVS